jgi:putative transposase
VSAYQVPQGLDKAEVRATLDALTREGAQRMLVNALEQEIEDFLGRTRYDHGPRRRRGYRNGVGKPRKIAVGCGTLEVRPPRVRVKVG